MTRAPRRNVSKLRTPARRTRRRLLRALAVGVIAVLCLGGVGAASAGQRATPTHLQIEPGVASLSTSWSVTSASNLAGFRVRWRPLRTPSSPWSKIVELGAKARSYAITGLSAAVYQVRVRSLLATTRRSASGHKRIVKRPGGVTTGTATALAGGGGLPEEEAPKEHPKEKPKEEEPPKETEPPEEEPPEEEPAEEGSGSGCTLYGSPSGNDAGKGTQAAPLKTVHALLTKLKAGQTGCLAQGTYEGFTVRAGESHGSAGAPVTITSSDARAPATISDRVVTMPGADYLTFTHLNFTDSGVTFPSVTIGSAHTTWTDDDVTAPRTICFETPGAGQYGPGEDTLIERVRVHNCGQPFTCDVDEPPCGQPPLDGYHLHGLYDLGVRTTVRNSYFYDNSSKGILLRGSKESVIEHNVIDGNGSGILFGDLTPKNDTVRWNIITNSRGVCGTCKDYFGIWTFGSVGAGNMAVNNVVFGNESGNFGPHSGLTVAENIEVDPKFVNAAKHDYTLELDSGAIGYGPE